MCCASEKDDFTEDTTEDHRIEGWSDLAIELDVAGRQSTETQHVHVLGENEKKKRWDMSPVREFDATSDTWIRRSLVGSRRSAGGRDIHFT